MNSNLTVGIGDMKIARAQGVIITYALGSCIGITFYDPNIRLAALLHIMLPEIKDANDKNIFKFADSGIRETLRKFAAFGGMKSRIVCKIAGGAQMFQMSGAGTSGIGNIGDRNAAAVRAILAAEGIRIQKADCGANYARTMSIDAATGEVTVKSFGRPVLIL